MKWIKSFLLHPFFNRFNLLYLLAGFGGAIFTDVPHLGWIVLGGEALYLGVRGALDRSALPAFQLRRLPYKDRQRYLQLWAMADRAKHDLATNKNLYAAMSASRQQIGRLLSSCLELLILRHRLDRYVNARRGNYDSEIAKLRARMALADEKDRALLQSNLQVLEKRQAVYADLLRLGASLETRLNTIEHSLRLLGEVSVGMSDPAEVNTQVEVILANVEDAESFVHELHGVVDPLRVRS